MKTLLQLALLFATFSTQAATVQQFQPQGRVVEQSRPTVRFSAAMINLGDATAAAPFNIECGNIAGEGRWIDERSWSWQMSRPLQAGERCIFTLKTGLTATSGETVTGKSRFEFLVPPRAPGVCNRAPVRRLRKIRPSSSTAAARSTSNRWTTTCGARPMVSASACPRVR
ncbi:MAG: hypothetical protein IPJ38_00895 [Dechloromonas sp.]|uniref:Uncharacterized protein n=1 Tax=Candidatus Dechloromonas phosphorivorans TaxID=2899244 RepID=A0A935N1R2_9RHOO|nr:hypothetical protein [Candidatus Dechloromonas phosphorivorans]